MWTPILYSDSRFTYILTQIGGQAMTDVDVDVEWKGQPWGCGMQNPLVHLQGLARSWLHECLDGKRIITFPNFLLHSSPACFERKIVLTTERERALAADSRP